MITVSGKEINNLLVSGEAASNKSSEDLINAAEAYADEQIMDLKEKQNDRKRALMKLGAMGVITVIILVFATIAWFTQNRQVEPSGVQIAAGGPNYDILVLDNGSNGRYYDYHSLVRDESAVQSN